MIFLHRGIEWDADLDCVVERIGPHPAALELNVKIIAVTHDRETLSRTAALARGLPLHDWEAEASESEVLLEEALEAEKGDPDFDPREMEA